VAVDRLALTAKHVDRGQLQRGGLLIFREDYDRSRPKARSFRSYYRECNSGFYSLGREITLRPVAGEAGSPSLAWKPVIVGGSCCRTSTSLHVGRRECIFYTGYGYSMLITGDHWWSLRLDIRLAASQLRDTKYAVSQVYCLSPTLIAVRKETLLTDASATVWNSLDLP
jgi:hypothetical protein